MSVIAAVGAAIIAIGANIAWWGFIYPSILRWMGWF